MSTRYLLHGGNTSDPSPENDQFFAKFTDIDKTEIHILLCYWAREIGGWDQLRNRDQEKILSQTNKQVTFSVTKGPSDIYEKLKKADVLYVAGGSSEPITTLLPQVAKLGQHLGGKTYIGSSMGAFVASQNYVLSFDEQDDKTVYPGLGLLPIYTLCHWNVEEKKAEKLKLLISHSPKTPILTLNEHQTVELFT